MGIALTSIDDHAESQVSTPQGRTRFVLIFDENGEYEESIPCSDREAVWGVGLSLAHLFVNKGVKVFLTPFCGPYCFQTLQLIGVQVITGIQGIVQEVLRKFLQEKLEPAREANIDWDAMNEDHEMRELMSRLQRQPGGTGGPMTKP